jgi:hypothetical protein
MIIGAGGYNMEDHWGNIYRYDLKRKRLTAGVQIKQFWYNMLSPSRNYILYEYGSELSNFMNFYDVRQDKNFEAAAYFNFRKEFPKLRKTAEFPLLWVGDRDRFLAVIHSGLRPGDDELTPEEKEEQNKAWLALFDVPQRKIVWKKLAYRVGFPSSYQLLEDNKALVDYDDEVFELSLVDGTERRIHAIDGRFLSVSPDKRKIAFIKKNQVFTASPDGSDKKLILELPADWRHAADYKNVGVRSPMWLETGNTLILFGELQLLVVTL